MNKTIIATVSGHRGIQDIEISLDPDANVEEIKQQAEVSYMKQHGIADEVKLQVYEIVAVGQTQQ